MKLFHLIIILSCCLQAIGQNYSLSAIPAELMENAHTVIRKHEVTYEVHSPKSATETVVLVATILNENSYYNMMRVYYNEFVTIKSFEGMIFNAQGRLIGKLKKSDIGDYPAVESGTLYSDSKMKVAEASFGSYPYTVAFSYVREHSGIRDYPDWMPQEDFEVGVEYSSFRIGVPEDMPLLYQTKNTDIEPVATTEKGRNYLFGEAKNLPPIVEENFRPLMYDYLPTLNCAPSEFEVAGYKGSMKDWKSFGNFIYELNEDKGKLSPGMRDRVKQLTAKCENDQEKIAVLYDYLQENTRYVSVQLGIGGWQTFPASYVEQNKYGDCKALTYFMRAMLEEAGVEAYPALINSGYNPPLLTNDFTEPMFNHVVLYVPSEEPTWLECTSTYNPPNYLGLSNENRKALVIKPDASKLVETPKSTLENNRKKQTIVAEINQDGSAKVDITTLATGNLQRWMRYEYNTLSAKEMKESLIEYLPLSGFQINDYRFDIKKDEPKVELEMNIEVDKYATTSGSRVFFRPNILNRINVPEKLDNRVAPLQKKSASAYEDSITYIVPGNLVLENAPKEPIDIKSDFGRYQMEVIAENGQILYRRNLELYPFDLPADRYDDLRDFYLKVAKADKLKLAFVKQ